MSLAWYGCIAVALFAVVFGVLATRCTLREGRRQEHRSNRHL
jgi:hypothetical protein